VTHPGAATPRDEAGEDEPPPFLRAEMLAPPGPPAPRAFEAGMRPLPPVTGALILANMVAFSWQLGAGALRDEGAILAAGALRRAEVMAGEAWRLVTAAFLHADPGHLLGNVLALFVLGMAAEHALGARRALLVYLLSAVGGGLASVVVRAGPSVGASGAVFGFMGAVVAFLWTHRRRYLLRDRRVAVAVGLWATYQLGAGMLDPWTDNAAHLGGLVTGAVATLLLARPGREGETEGTARAS
jgi:rhomboid protease GluP